MMQDVPMVQGPYLKKDAERKLEHEVKERHTTDDIILVREIVRHKGE